MGRQHFERIGHRLALAKKALLMRVAKMEARGILEAVPAADGGTYREYRLTARARALRILLDDAMAGGRG